MLLLLAKILDLHIVCIRLLSQTHIKVQKPIERRETLLVARLVQQDLCQLKQLADFCHHGTENFNL